MKVFGFHSDAVNVGRKRIAGNVSPCRIGPYGDTGLRGTALHGDSRARNRSPRLILDRALNAPRSWGFLPPGRSKDQR